MLAVLLGGLSMVSPFSIDTFFPAFHAMQKALQVEAWQLQQVLTAYMIPFAFAALVHGPLSDALGRRPVMIWGMALYTVGSIACTLAPNYMSLIAARTIQGMTAGVGVVVGRAVVRDLYEGPRAQRLMSVTTMIFSLAPAAAPIIGGWAHVAFGWRAVFAVMVLCGLIFSFSAWWRLPETHPVANRIPFSGRNLINASLAVARHREFMLLAVSAGFNFGSVSCLIGAAPMIVEGHWHLGETDYWMLFIPIISGILVGAIISGRLAGRMPSVRQARLGLAVPLAVSAARVF
jgi:DHA1 family bicyclomycin/chloramphenicol resistance-like MFS transporter